jgi:hypothetical protein
MLPRCFTLLPYLSSESPATDPPISAETYPLDSFGNFARNLYSKADMLPRCFTLLPYLSSESPATDPPISAETYPLDSLGNFARKNLYSKADMLPRCFTLLLYLSSESPATDPLKLTLSTRLETLLVKIYTAKRTFLLAASLFCYIFPVNHRPPTHRSPLKLSLSTYDDFSVDIGPEEQRRIRRSFTPSLCKSLYFTEFYIF